MALTLFHRTASLLLINIHSNRITSHNLNVFISLIYIRGTHYYNCFVENQLLVSIVYHHVQLYGKLKKKKKWFQYFSWMGYIDTFLFKYSIELQLIYLATSITRLFLFFFFLLECLLYCLYEGKCNNIKIFNIFNQNS